MPFCWFCHEASHFILQLAKLGVKQGPKIGWEKEAQVSPVCLK